jgi:hypothetical protein
LAQLVLRVIQAVQQVRKEVKAILAQQDRKALLVLKVLQVQLARVDSKVYKVSSGQQVHKELLDLQAHLGLLAIQVRLGLLVYKALQEILEKLDHQASLDQHVPQVYQEL